MSIRRRHEPVPVTGDLVDRWIAATLDQEIFRLRPDAAERSKRRFEEAPKPSTLPAHREIMADALGVLWVQNYSPPWEDSNIWSLFGTDGSWICDVELPPGLEVMQIGEGHLLGLRQDELDVEYVQLHEVVRG